MEIYQFLVPTLSIVLIIFTLKWYKEGEFSLRSSILWISFWTFLIILSLFPDAVSFFIAEVLGFKSNINALIFLVFGFLSYLNFRLFQIVAKLNRKITELTRKITLDNERKKEK